VKRLAQQQIRANARRGLVRFSPHFYNAPEQIEMIAAALGTTAATSRTQEAYLRNPP
jgi:hypothetical protein